MVSAVNCVKLMIHRPVPLKQIRHYILIKKNKKMKELNEVIYKAEILNPVISNASFFITYALSYPL